MHNLSKINFGDDGFENMFVYKPTLNTLDLKKYRALIMFLVGNMEYILLNLNHFILLSCIV